ncbi:30S ribosomal protein S5 [Patescibacteria group bacterium]|mgnify:CR=1 FL=1|nr:30S ribosomal protein S5 [Patescibacteria group bacterium]
MSEEQTKEQAVTEPTDTSSDTGSTPAGADIKNSSQKSFGGARRSFGGRKPDGRKGSRFRSSDRPKPEFEQKIINISRVTRVVKGGRRLSFRVDMVIGDKKGRVGLGSGKATDTSLAIQKAFTHARKNLIKVGLTKTQSIPHAVEAKVTSSRLEMRPNKGRGLVAGSTLRTVLELAGITDVTGRIHSRSKNKLNNAKAAMKALTQFSVAMDPVQDAPEKEKRSRFNNNRRGPNNRPRRTPTNQ